MSVPRKRPGPLLTAYRDQYRACSDQRQPENPDPCCVTHHPFRPLARDKTASLSQIALPRAVAVTPHSGETRWLRAQQPGNLFDARRRWRRGPYLRHESETPVCPASFRRPSQPFGSARREGKLVDGFRARLQAMAARHEAQ